MAAFPRPSLRSSSRLSAGLDDLPATDLQHNPSPSTKRGKRTRDVSPALHRTLSLKRQKVQTQDFLHPKSFTQSHEGKDLVLRNVTKHLVTQVESSRKSDRLRPLSQRAVSTTNSNESIPEGNGVSVGSTVLSETARAEKRSLRSHDGGSRSKSELALYFSNYDELVSVEAKAPGMTPFLQIRLSLNLTSVDFLTADTRIHITDEPSKSNPSILQPSTQDKATFQKLRTPTNLHSPIVNGSSQTLGLLEDDSQGLNKARRIDFSSIERHARNNAEDPLTDAVYFKAHRRAERQEKQLRNIEKERSQHEKVQLERLLDGLKGHDWLRVMGISGITDSEKKIFEPKRDYFIEEVSSLIEKFKAWKEEEKRRKVEREQYLLAEDDEESESKAEFCSESEGDPPDLSDVDAWAARQLHQEASSATESQAGKRRKHHAQTASAPLIVEKPFTSFYSKPYLRDAAVGKHRRGRTRFAFGQPLPNVVEKPFQLPSDMLSQDAIAASARSRRRARRESKE